MCQNGEWKVLQIMTTRNAICTAPPWAAGVASDVRYRWDITNRVYSKSAARQTNCCHGYRDFYNLSQTVRLAFIWFSSMVSLEERERGGERESRCLCIVICDLLSPTGTICLKPAISLLFPPQCSEQEFWSSHTLKTAAGMCVCASLMPVIYLISCWWLWDRPRRNLTGTRVLFFLKTRKLQEHSRGIKTHIFLLWTCGCLWLCGRYKMKQGAKEMENDGRMMRKRCRQVRGLIPFLFMHLFFC